ncbi:zinc metallopeptidase [Chryseobacterium koreense]|uniref:Membrane protein n=1 Tax=Chryseobacterium koreense CCUG 49689 TaxID=1304281 RepID=A0A0J7LUR4_9FLAO|nr:zinc metallopeptidase [Chryseobacterium koreense]KMQ72645.1 membrane protein [Chryseobacterium koreense CCUG 49689]
MGSYYLIIGVIFIVSMIVQNRLKSKFAHYSQMRLQNGMSGKEIAEKMLRDYNINDVQVISVPGRLTDHYNPADKTVNLSEEVYMQRNAAAAAVAAHECGHAVQHAVGYSMLQLRSKMVPIVNVSSRLLQFVLMAGILVMASSGNKTLLTVGVVLFAVTTLFAFVTLPVEYDASNRALKWLESSGTLGRSEHDAAQDSLKWAARTYVVAALGSLAQLIYFASMLSGRRD